LRFYVDRRREEIAAQIMQLMFQPFLRFYCTATRLGRAGAQLTVSTLLEILPLVCSILVGF
jgi:hypothetical protein